jgi:LmbE family N-acetylglucosaminyl deacetylase
MDVRKMKIVMICAHPGDAFDDSGGTLCHHIERGDEVIVLLITSGARSHAAMFTDEKRKPKGQRDDPKAAMTAEQIEEYKDREVLAAGRELGITDIRFLHEADDILLVKEETIIKVADFIRREKPDIFFTHHPLQVGGLLTTHAIVGQIAILGWEAAGARWTKDEKLPPHQVSQIFFVGTVNGKPWNLCQFYRPEWNIYVDITDVVDRKVKALDHLESQRYDGIYARKRAEVADGWKGTRVDVPYAETFVPMIPEVHKYLPVMQSTLDTRKDWTSRIARLSKMIPHTIPYKGEQIV